MTQNQGPTVLGLDLSINGTGWFIEFGRNGKAYGTIKHPPALRHPEYTLDRLFIITRELRELVSLAHLVAIESLAFSARGRATKDLAGLQWIIRLLCFDLGIDFCTPNNKAAKLYAAGNGNASKEEIAKAVKEQWGWKFQDDNQTDAFVLCQMAKNIISKPPETLTEWQVRALRRKQHLQEVKSRRASRAKLMSTLETSIFAGGLLATTSQGRGLVISPSGLIEAGPTSELVRSTSKSEKSRKKKV